MSEREKPEPPEAPGEDVHPEDQCRLEFEERWDDIEYLIRKPFCCK